MVMETLEEEEDPAESAALVQQLQSPAAPRREGAAEDTNPGPRWALPACLVSGGRDRNLVCWDSASGEFLFAKRYCHGSEVSAVDVAR